MSASSPRRFQSRSGNRAGLVHGFLVGRDAGRAGRIASVAASYVVEQTGTVEHAHTAQEFAARHRRVHAEMAFSKPVPEVTVAG